jgi:hypothetical protein
MKVDITMSIAMFSTHLAGTEMFSGHPTAFHAWIHRPPNSRVHEHNNRIHRSSKMNQQMHKIKANQSTDLSPTALGAVASTYGIATAAQEQA